MLTVFVNLTDHKPSHIRTLTAAPLLQHVTALTLNLEALPLDRGEDSVVVKIRL